MTYTPAIGAISSGTHQTGDLMISFADELRRINSDHGLVHEADAVQTLWAAGWNNIYDNDMALDLVDALQDALSEHAPPYCYFGAHEGDGACFGFWPAWDMLDDLPHVDDPANVLPGEDCVFVNDHGNVTIYRDGTILWDCV